MSETRATILVVDDVPDDIAVLEGILKPEYQIKVARDGAAALRIARGDPPPDLVLLDIMMPGMDGFEVCRALKEESSGAAIPVIFLTAKLLADDERRGFELGAVDYIRKPVDPDVVRSRVRLQIESRHELLAASEVRYRRLFETARDGILIVDARSRLIVDANPALSTMLGVALEDFLGSRTDELPVLAKILPASAETSGEGRASHVAVATSDGRRIHLELTSGSYRVNGSELRQYSFRDITARKTAEAELSLKSAALEAAANAVIITDRQGRIRWANAAFGILSGYPVAEVIGRTTHELLYSGRQNAEFYRDLWNTVLSGYVWRGRLVNRRRSGEEYYEEMTITPVRDEIGFVEYFVSVKNDITEQVLVRERLEAARRKKDELLREVHHRVKNNMQVMISLLHVSALDISDDTLRGKLEDITRRMHAMALIHEQFYGAVDMSRIDFAIYLRQLLDRLSQEFPSQAVNACIDCEEGVALLDLEQAIPAGLIVEELVTNSLKFAFAGRQSPGRVSVTQRVLEGGELQVEVGDDGVGLPAEVEPERSTTLGMLLIRILAEQLRGRVEFIRGEGTLASLRFLMDPGPLSTAESPQT